MVLWWTSGISLLNRFEPGVLYNGIIELLSIVDSIPRLFEGKNLSICWSRIHDGFL